MFLKLMIIKLTGQSVSINIMQIFAPTIDSTKDLESFDSDKKSLKIKQY